MLKYRTNSQHTKEDPHTVVSLYYFCLDSGLAWLWFGMPVCPRHPGAESLMKQSVHKVTSLEAHSFGYR